MSALSFIDAKVATFDQTLWGYPKSEHSVAVPGLPRHRLGLRR
jgi:hypothetical protein